jgi:hypothetical protein
MTYFTVLAVISFLGTVALVGWIGSVSLGIHREDRRNRHDTSVSLHGMAPGRASRVARQATGCHWV